MELTIRPIRREEFPLLADFLYDAIYRSDPSSPLPRQIIDLALLTNGMLKGKNLTEFIQRSISLIEK